MANKKYVEAKARKNVYPSDIEKFLKQGVSLLLVQAKMSQKTKDKCKESGIIAYQDLEDEKVKEVLRIYESESKESEKE